MPLLKQLGSVAALLALHKSGAAPLVANASPPPTTIGNAAPVSTSTAQRMKNALDSKACIPRSQCCRVCSEGKACGNWCTKAIFNCEKARGCACDAGKICSQP